MLQSVRILLPRRAGAAVTAVRSTRVTGSWPPSSPSPAASSFNFSANCAFSSTPVLSGARHKLLQPQVPLLAQGVRPPRQAGYVIHLHTSTSPAVLATVKGRGAFTRTLLAPFSAGSTTTTTPPPPPLTTTSPPPPPSTAASATTPPISILQPHMEPFLDPLHPPDGLTRYPTWQSSQGMLRGLDYFGTIVFALSGSVTAGTTGMDLLGCTIVGTITAVGGGTVRDVLMAKGPVFWMLETEYIWLCIATAVTTFFAWSYMVDNGFSEEAAFLKWADALGVGAFCVIGAQNGVRSGMSPMICVIAGMLTATFGGVIRDVLCQRPPRILHSKAEVYASTALLGAGTYIGMRAAGAGPMLKIWSAFGVAVVSRYIAWKHGVRLPSWAQGPTLDPPPLLAAVQATSKKVP